MQGLTPSQIRKVQKAYPILKKIQQLTNVPWQAMAAIWYRESFSVSPPKTPGGPWQFDPPPPDQTLYKYLYQFTKTTPEEKEAIIKKGINDFYAGGVLAACHLQKKVDGNLTLTSPDDLVKQAIYRYNGAAYGSADKSPYVMNNYDREHMDMRLRGTIPDGHGGRKWIDIVDQRPGAFTIYKQLKRIFP